MNTWLLIASDSNRLGDPDTWPEAVAYVGVALCALGAYYVWCRYGGDNRE